MSAPEKFSGVLTPVITPFKDDLSPDADRLLRQCKWMLSQNVGLAVFGTNSEANSLSTDEKIELMDALVAGGIDPARMMPGTGCCALSDSVKLTSHAVTLGCGGALMLPPFYYKGVSDDGLFASYSEIIQKVGSADLRIYLYHIPPISNVPLSLDLIERLIKEYPDTVVGIKDSSGDWSNTKAMLDAGWDDFRVFAGAETFLLDVMRNGGAGCISATANVNPAAIHNLYAEWQSDKADDLQAGLDVIRDIFQSYPMIPALKAAAAIYGDDMDWCRVRPPLVALDDAQLAGLTEDLKAIDFAMPGLKEAAA
ncbi:MAG: dihydrodipicolinate synthase family protein [Rhodospirillaceae bacterium]|jgi:4-hydroxy-tetrahydrodipicolinate synthase|nr:dihydrodipicolinate synthase family protein [Rhodospirillaceae bacterium]MBT4588618.1 dihydrodipicolinate synthase family protein [Rhodospirillaceae bacterium]MBT4938522.1 dihydrodipicolinate synthase family protein [Rhodospirillaceae bacterium]MBT5939661.1 dihydrodipicolinate synthase family protein [Rhodospirillaceae bacterium]MBT7266277.1 dihydrodipicolinate synthase family protein [Rhodospirillaceae bacterium]